MKQRIVALLSWPILVAVGFAATKLGEKYSQSLDDLQYGFDFE